jgi:hypothetical protein
MRSQNGGGREVETEVADWRRGEVLRVRLTEAHGLAVGLFGTRRPGRWCSAAAPEWAGGIGCRGILNPRRQKLRRLQVVAEGVEREVRRPWEAAI